ncbi:MAG: hypothetical protein WDM71_06875 [Ferruginibacter sp.]
MSSILQLDYSRDEGEWEPNEFGGNGNIEAIAFIKDLNETIYRDFPDVQTIAEEATDWPDISKPTFLGGMGFGMKWMMGWMHDTLSYFKMDPYFRQFHQDKFSFSMMYFFDENFMLPLSHDEVVHGKSPMIYKMPGDDWQKFAIYVCYILICLPIRVQNYYSWEMNLRKPPNGIIKVNWTGIYYSMILIKKCNSALRH